jgi:gamma-glutamylcyclotransferase (GGCT)/AIG2-like uncharacterized protein YtfP
MKLFVYSCNVKKELAEQRGLKYTSADGAVLEGYELGFKKPSLRQANKGYPSLEEKEGARVEGVLYDVDEETLASLDGYEGIPDRSKRIPVKVRLVKDGTEVECETHYGLVFKEGLRPSDLYIRRLLSGVETYGLSDEYAEFLEKFETIKNEPRR